MRFYTFLKGFAKASSDDDVIAFNGWIQTSEHPKKLPHAGLPQILLFLQCHPTSKQVKDGFVKVCLAYQKEPKNMLSLDFRDSTEKTLEFINHIYY